MSVRRISLSSCAEKRIGRDGCDVILLIWLCGVPSATGTAVDD
jgi:hypothetical protein